MRRVAIVGTGPSGFYTAKYLLRALETIKIDLIDQLPTPFGLVRSGVAPDHPEVKSVEGDFSNVAADERVRFMGNVPLGTDVDLSELRRCYDGVVLAYGADGDNRLGIPGEALDGVLSAREFVHWYNGHPDFTPDRGFDPTPLLDSTETVVIVGQGNVAVDCARVLGKSVDSLRTTDIAAHALEALSQSRVKRIVCVGRRGHVQAAMTMKELRELTKLGPECFLRLHAAELDAGLTDASLEEIKTQRATKRMDKLLRSHLEATAGMAEADDVAAHRRAIELRFLLSPIAIEPAADPNPNENRVGRVDLERNVLVGEAGQIRAVAAADVPLESIECGMVLRSIGYRSSAADASVPFDDARGVVPSARGRILASAADGAASLAGTYCAGWLKRGPSGIIGTNIPDAVETVDALVADSSSGAFEAGNDAALAALEKRLAPQLVEWGGFCRINTREVEHGAPLGKPREKIVHRHELLDVANNS